MVSTRPSLREQYRLAFAQIWDWEWTKAGLRAMPWFIQQARAYHALPGAEHMQLRDLYPQLHDRHPTHEIGGQYFFMSAWAMRRILAARPTTHLDIAGNVNFVAALSASLPVTFLDYRPLEVTLSGLTSIPGDILALPMADNSQESVSCLHVAEHIGLGRYGDPLDPAGTRKAAGELARILAPGGILYFALPVGSPRTCFNAHRVHTAVQIRDYFAGLELVEYSGLDDNGQFHEHVPVDTFDRSSYACGMFRLTKEGACA